MTLTPSEIADLSSNISRWEIAEYCFAGAVTVACAGEYIADFTNWFTGGEKERKDRLTKRCTLLLVAALAFELICLVRTNWLSEQLIGSLDTLAEDAAGQSAKALGDSGTALTQSGRALIDSDAALSNSREALNAQRELDQLKAPRALVNSKGLTVKLSKYKGTEYTINVFPDGESIQLAKTLDIALHESGWKRKQALTPGAPSTNTFGDGPNDQTNLCLERGIVVHMAGGASPESIVATSKRNVRELPKNLQIGVALCSILPSHIDPPDARNVGKDVQLAGGKSLDDPMQICVGQKPNSFTPKKAQSSAKPTSK